MEFTKLSEAIRCGIAITKPAIRHFTQMKNGELCACALGAAYVCVTGERPRNGNEVKAMLTKMGIGDPMVNIPEVGWEGSLMHSIYNLNDNKKFSREKIADILEREGL